MTRVAEHPVLVDEPPPDELSREIRASDLDVAVELRSDLLEHVAHVAPTRRLFASTASSDVENTNLGVAFQMRANSRMASVDCGFDSPVGQ